MSKVTKSNTKDEILAELAEAKKEQGLLHTEITTLNTKIEGLEILGQEEDVKKRGLIKQLAIQTTDIELGKKMTEKYNADMDSLQSTAEELMSVQSKLDTANKKVELLTTELAGLKSRA